MAFTTNTNGGVQRAVLAVTLSIVCGLHGPVGRVAGDTAVPLTLMPDAVEKGAVCLDGSPPGYYWKHGRDAGANKWIVHQEGGGWCRNEENCLERSRTRLGSSKLFPANMSLASRGFLNDDCSRNPVFCDFNLLYMPYCDGGSFSGNRDEAITVNGTKIYMRGKRILDAIFDEFASEFNKAEEMILTGCSAGGLATYLHADYPVPRLPKSAKYAVLADAGYFIDALTMNGKQLIRPTMQYIYHMQNASGGVNQKCIATTPAEDQWKCYFAQYTFPHIESPFFALQSQYDTWQLRGILSLPCVPPNCTQQQMVVFNNWRQTFLEAFQPVMNGSQATGIFADSCLAHCQTVAELYWNGFAVGGQTIRETFTAWYLNTAGKEHREIDCAYPCNTHCKPQAADSIDWREQSVVAEDILHD